MQTTTMPSDDELRARYAYLLDNDRLMNFACWNETNTDAPFNPEQTIAFAKSQMQDLVHLTDKVVEDVCQR